MKTNPATALGIIAAGLLGALPGCSHDTAYVPAMLAPAPAPGGPEQAPRARQPIDLTRPGAVAWGVQEATVIDTRRMGSMPPGPWPGAVRTLREVLPPHGKAAPYPAGLPNDLPLGATLSAARTVPTPQFPGIGQTPWVPPDPTLAVGPNHVIATVNMAIAFYKKDGTSQFFQYLDNTGNPGFFEDVGAGGFTFDPKCFYDHLAQRFVVVAPEVYGSTEAWITIAVSDDADPNGVWYKYRTDAVITVGSQTFWWDYPGFGYDGQGYYVTGNLFGLNQGGWGGVGFRVFNKTPMLSGQPAVYSTLRDGGAASVQVAQHHGSPIAPYFVSVASGSSLRIHAVRNPITAPVLSSTTVAVPGFSGPVESGTTGGSISSVDARIFNAHWRAGKLYATHHVAILSPQGYHNVARWYQVNTNNWPTSGSVGLGQSGNVDGGDGVHHFFPAIYSNAAGQVGMVFGRSSASTPVQVCVTGRRPTDPNGTMGAPTLLTTSPSPSSGRWGDYYDVTVDPANDTRFWVVGETSESFGWSTWIGSFTVDANDAPIPIFDEAGNAYDGIAKAVDVLANDFDTNGDALTISAFDSTSAQGGTIARSVGTGPGGRDRLLYTSAPGHTGPDTFNYTAQDPGGLTGTTYVNVDVLPPVPLRDPDAAPHTGPGARVNYYNTGIAIGSVPDYDIRTPYLTETVPQVNYPSSDGAFAGSGKADGVGARFRGYFLAPQDDVYTFFTQSDDGSLLKIGTTLVVNNNGIHGWQERSGAIGLRAGLHAITVDFFERTASAGLIALVEGAAFAKQPIPAANWRHDVCPADYNGDDYVDGIDYDGFVNDFEAGNGAADFNGDGFVDGIDYDAFMLAFEAGC